MLFPPPFVSNEHLNYCLSYVIKEDIYNGPHMLNMLYLYLQRDAMLIWTGCQSKHENVHQQGKAAGIDKAKQWDLYHLHGKEQKAFQVNILWHRKGKKINVGRYIEGRGSYHFKLLNRIYVLIFCANGLFCLSLLLWLRSKLGETEHVLASDCQTIKTE